MPRISCGCANCVTHFGEPSSGGKNATKPLKTIRSCVCLYVLSVGVGYYIYSPAIAPQAETSRTSKVTASSALPAYEEQAPEGNTSQSMLGDTENLIVFNAEAPAVLALETELNAIRKENADWLSRKMREHSLSPLDVSYGCGALRITLQDPAMRAAFERYLFDTLAVTPGCEYLLEKTVQALALADAGVFSEIMKRALREENWPIASVCLATSRNNKMLEPDELLHIAQEAAQGSNQAQFATIRAIEGRTDQLPREALDQLMIEIYMSGGCENIAIANHAFSLLSGEGMNASSEVLQAMEDTAVNGETIEQRSTGMVHLMAAMLSKQNGALSGDTASRILRSEDAWVNICTVLSNQMLDPDPLMRLVAARRYTQWAEQLDMVALTLQSGINLNEH